MAVFEDADKETVVDSIIETGRDKIAGGGEEFIVDPSVEAVLEAAERIDEEVEGPRIESSPQ